MLEQPFSLSCACVILCKPARHPCKRNNSSCDLLYVSILLQCIREREMTDGFATLICFSQTLTLKNICVLSSGEFLDPLDIGLTEIPPIRKPTKDSPWKESAVLQHRQQLKTKMKYHKVEDPKVLHAKLVGDKNCLKL